MNTFFALALACTLSTAPRTDDKSTSRETSTYVITDKLAIWVTDAGKLKLSVAHHTGDATIELRNGKATLYKNRVNLRNGVQQTFDLSQTTEGAYQIQVTIGQEVTIKTIHIKQVQERLVQLS